MHASSSDRKCCAVYASATLGEDRLLLLLFPRSRSSGCPVIVDFSGTLVNH